MNGRRHLFAQGRRADLGPVLRRRCHVHRRVLAKAKDLAPIVKAYQAYLKEKGGKEVRSEDEYVFELLMLGTLWRAYADDAHDVSSGWTGIMSALSSLRQRGGIIKSVADSLRGILATVFLSPTDRDWHPRATLEHFDRLLQWMDATGDYVQEVNRIRGWRDYWAGQQSKAVAADIDVAIGFAAWFEGSSLTALGRYTPNVEQFLSEKQRDTGGRRTSSSPPAAGSSTT